MANAALFMGLFLVAVPVLVGAKTLQTKGCGGCRMDILSGGGSLGDLKKLMPRVLAKIDRLPSRERQRYAAMLVRIEIAEGMQVAGYCYYAQLLVGESECNRDEQLVANGGQNSTNCAIERNGSERERYVVGIFESLQSTVRIVFGENVDTVGCGRHQ